MMLGRIVALFAVIAFAAGISACNTIEGAGKDVKATGQAIENAAKDSKPKSSGY